MTPITPAIPTKIRADNRTRLFKLPNLHENQQRIYDAFFEEDAKFVVCCAGRRFGKTRVALAIVLDLAMNYGKRVWWVSPAHSVSDKQWRQVKRIVGKRYTRKYERARRMEFYYKNSDGTIRYGELDFKSGDRSQLLRGEGLDFVVIDEAAFVDPDVWNVLRPSLTDRKGRALIISTPNGMNWFYFLYMHAKREEHQSRWRAFHFTSYDNPFIDPQELEDARNTLIETKFREEHLAEFLEDAGRVFRNIHAVCIHPNIQTPYIGRFVVGVDLGRTNDATVISIIDADKDRQVHVERMAGVTWQQQKDRIIRIYEMWKPVKILIERNAAGSPIIEDLMKHIPKSVLMDFYTVMESKARIIDQLALALEHQTLGLISKSDPVGELQYNELASYEITKTQSGMNWKYSAPRGFHDDHVIALALSYEARRMIGKRGFTASTNPFFTPKKAGKLKKMPTFMSRTKEKAFYLKKELLENARRNELSRTQ